MKALLKYLPKKYRHKLMRSVMKIPYKVSSKLTFKLAQTQDELEQAFALLHDCYVERSLMAPHPSGLRCNFFSALPYTSVLIAKFDGRVIGTVSLIKDSSLGLPSDTEFKEENDLLRKKGSKLAEVSALAIHRRFRRTGSDIYLYLMKYITEYSTKVIGCDTLTCSVHPKGMDFYEAILGFNRTSLREVRFGYVNGALAVHGHIHVNAEYWASMRYGLYSDKAPHKNLYHFSLIAGPFEFPLTNGIFNKPVMTLEMLRYFFIEKTDLFNELPQQDLARLLSVYGLYFDVSQLSLPMNVIEIRQAFRFHTEMKAVLQSGPDIYFGNLYNLSTDGAFLNTDEKLQVGEIYKIQFKVGNESFSLQGVVRWENKTQTDHHPQGFGLQFTGPTTQVRNFLRTRHLYGQKLTEMNEEVPSEVIVQKVM